MIGAFINSYKGIKDNIDYKKRLAAAEQQLQDIQSIEQLLATIDEPYDRVLATNQLLLASYHTERQKNHSLKATIKQWEMVKKQMNTTIQQTEQQLQNIAATKLDIARLVASLTQLTNEFDLELQTMKQQFLETNDTTQLESKLNTFATQYEQLNQNYNTLTAKTKTQQQALDSNQDQLTTLEQQLSKNVKQLNKENKTQNTRLDSLQQALSTQEAAHLQLKTDTTNRLDQLSLKSKTMTENIDTLQENLKTTEQQLDQKLLTLQQQLDAQKIQWTTSVNQIETSITALAKAQKKSLLQWTIPLYVCVVGILVWLVV